MLNLKGVSFKMNGNSHASLNISKSEIGPVTARDIELKGDIEVVNPEHVIGDSWILAGGRERHLNAIAK